MRQVRKAIALLLCLALCLTLMPAAFAEEPGEDDFLVWEDEPAGEPEPDPGPEEELPFEFEEDPEAEAPEALRRVSEILPIDGREICDSSTRYGYYILTADAPEQMTDLLRMSGLEEELL